MLNFAYHLPMYMVDNPLFPGILRAGAEYQEKEAVH